MQRFSTALARTSYYIAQYAAILLQILQDVPTQWLIAARSRPML
jgi:hypothetical protein